MFIEATSGEENEGVEWQSAKGENGRQTLSLFSLDAQLTNLTSW